MNDRIKGESVPLWIETKMPEFTELRENLTVDVAIVGGGIAGLTTAYLLMKAGFKVCVLEAYGLASGQSARTTAQFVTALDNRYFELENFHGAEVAKLTAESHRAAIDQVEKIVLDEKIDCDLEKLSGFLFARDDSRPHILQRELKAARQAGLLDVEMRSRSPMNFFDTGPCLEFPEQLQLHPVKYLAGLARCIAKGGGHIFTDTHVTHVEGGAAAHIKTQSGNRVNCKSVVVATNSPVNDLFAIHTKQAAYRTYVLGFIIPPGSVPKALFWDTLEPYHYIRLSKSDTTDQEILIVGGEDHKTGQEEYPARSFRKLESWTRARFPMAGKILYEWSGQVMEPVDSLAYLGHNPLDRKNVYVITGDSGNGMTHCTIGAMLICDQIQGQPNPWENIYDPSRVSIRASKVYLRENANVARQYSDWFSRSPRPRFQNMAKEEGIVFRDGVRMIAAYKDQVGNLEFMSAACPHLAGVVSWNEVEKSWDCPCHGSRFDCHGKVIEGPAIRDLKKIPELNREISDEQSRLRPQLLITEKSL